MDEIISKQFVCMYMYKCNVGDVPTIDIHVLVYNECLQFPESTRSDFLHGDKHIIIS